MIALLDSKKPHKIFTNNYIYFDPISCKLFVKHFVIGFHNYFLRLIEPIIYIFSKKIYYLIESKV